MLPLLTVAYRAGQPLIDIVCPINQSPVAGDSGFVEQPAAARPDVRTAIITIIGINRSVFSIDLVSKPATPEDL
ncbi:hypothetical protein ES703_82599 [subsurface metagenome]